MDKKFLPMAYHPRTRMQLEADGLISAPKKAVAPAPKRGDPKFEEKSMRKKIIEEKPKKKVVKEYFKTKIGKRDTSDSDSDS